MGEIHQLRPLEPTDPRPIPAHLISKPTHLMCGACGFNGMVNEYIFSDGPECYEPVCNCPIPATMLA